jgi:electron transport complex protein RnfC
MFLNPQSLGELARAGRYDEMTELHLSDCMLCGSCSFVCPAHIPLAQLFFLSKSALKRKPPVVEAPPPVPAGAV